MIPRTEEENLGITLGETTSQESKKKSRNEDASLFGELRTGSRGERLLD